MICEKCGNSMVVVGKWGDGWEEPHETQWRCEHCGTECNELQGYGLTWEVSADD